MLVMFTSQINVAFTKPECTRNKNTTEKQKQNREEFELVLPFVSLFSIFCVNNAGPTGPDVFPWATNQCLMTRTGIQAQCLENIAVMCMLIPPEATVCYNYSDTFWLGPNVILSLYVFMSAHEGSLNLLKTGESRSLR